MENYSILRVEIEKSLRQALENQQFQLFYQPQFDLKSGRIVGAEALLRWWHPQKGLVLPGEFIAIAEDTGLIIPIGEWVLQQAWADCQLWHAVGQPLRVGVNLSAMQFNQSSVDLLLEQLIDESSIDACFLDLELTETLAMSQVNETLESM